MTDKDSLIISRHRVDESMSPCDSSIGDAINDMSVVGSLHALGYLSAVFSFIVICVTCPDTMWTLALHVVHPMT